MTSRLAKLGLIPGWMLTRNVNCKHKYGCYENVVISFHKVFFKSFAIKTAFNSLFYLGSIRKLVLKLFD